MCSNDPSVESAAEYVERPDLRAMSQDITSDGQNRLSQAHYQPIGEHDSDVRVPNGGTTVVVNGEQVQVYGNLRGFELLSLSNGQGSSLVLADSDEEEEEDRRRAEAERAIVEAERAHEARRSAPLPSEHRSRILDVMKSIDLGGFRPAWADSVPEYQWIKRITAGGNSGL